MEPHVIVLDAKRDQEFLKQRRKDPLIKEILGPGDRVVVCSHCRMVFLEETWEAIKGQLGHSEETLMELPVAAPSFNRRTTPPSEAGTEPAPSTEMQTRPPAVRAPEPVPAQPSPQAEGTRPPVYGAPRHTTEPTGYRATTQAATNTRPPSTPTEPAATPRQPESGVRPATAGARPRPTTPQDGSWQRRVRELGNHMRAAGESTRERVSAAGRSLNNARRHWLWNSGRQSSNGTAQHALTLREIPFELDEIPFKLREVRSY